MKIISRLLFLLLIVLPAAQANFVEVFLLGTGTPRPSIERFGSATLVKAGGHNLLFDAGRGATIRLQQAGITPNLIDKVFLTHLHSDHISGLDDLWITGWVWQRQSVLQVAGPLGTHELVKGLREAYAADISYRTENVNLTSDLANIDSMEINEGVVFDQDGVTVTAFLVEHAPVKPALGYRVAFGDRVIVISGDTTYSSNVVQQAKGADLLVHEITAASPVLLKRNKRLGKIVAYHTTPEQLARVLNATQPRMTVLNHVLLFGVSEDEVMQEIKKQYSGAVEMGYDLMRIGVGDTIQINAINREQ